MSGTNAFDPEFDLIDANTKEWIDARSSWLIDQFGRERIRSCQVALPTPAFFPDDFSGVHEGAPAIFDRLCSLMGIEHHSIDLMLFERAERVDSGMTTSSMIEREGDRFRLWIEVSRLDSPLELIATLARGLCQIHLIGHGRISEEVDDLAPLIDLLTVYLGLGVITANASLRDGSQLQRLCNTTMQMYGYALALFSNTRDEHHPQWRKSLRPDVRDAFQRTLKYHTEHGWPELRSVKTTSARPSIVGWESETDQEDLPQAETDEEIYGCTFCGAALSDSDEDVCEACQASIEENQDDIETERYAGETMHPRNRAAAMWGCLTVIAVAVTVVAVTWLELIPRPNPE